MPYFTANGVRLYYEDSQEGQTASPAETLVFSHGLLWSGHMFHKQVAALRSQYRIITYDHRGQGRSEITADGYDMDTLYQDAVALIEGLSLGRVHFAGLSMGGFIGMRLAARRPDLIRSLLLLETSAEGEPLENVGKYRTLCTVVNWLGTWAVAGPVMKIMFGQTFLNDPARADERLYWTKQLRQNKRSITRAVNGVIDRNPILPELGQVTAPTLVVVGDEDVATRPPKAQRIHEAIAGSQLVIVPRAGHSSSVEEPEAVTHAIRSFLESVGPDGSR
ncbi:alpha/beta fold hydrolase [Spirosoma sp. 209]|uniref:alpha/beta fold hydrolase n=1 Tax=Spirosoma sp. 209 TaxID=1955701 RepID=UPI00098D7569|nr:alpha/beta fold hydrolase [Spirosoma sp. 209]